MNKEALIKLLGLAADADDKTIEATLAGAQEELGGKTLTEALAVPKKEPQGGEGDKGTAGKPEDKPQGSNADDGEMAELKAQVATLSKKVVAMEVGNTSDGLVRVALSDGRLLPHQEASAHQLAAKDPEAFKILIDGNLALAAPDKTRTGGKGDADGMSVLTAEKATVAAQLGISTEDYAKAKQSDKGEDNMVITLDTLKALFTGFKKNFQDGLKMAESQYRKIAAVIPSSTASNTCGWLDQWPALREWVGNRIFQDVKAHGYAITNKHFESLIKVNRDDIEDDSISIYAPMTTGMGRTSAVHPDELVFALLKSAHATLCYDGQDFFDADHPMYEKAGGTGQASTVSSIFAGSEAAWHLPDTTRAPKPLIYRERRAEQFTAMTVDADEGVFMRNEYRCGVDGRCGVGLGFWQMAAKSQERLDTAGFEKAYSVMVSLKGDGGRPLAIRPNVLLAPPALENVARELVEDDRLANGAYDPNKGKAEVIVSPWLL